MRVDALIIIIALIFSVDASSQTLSGTWLGTYYRNNVSNKRLFYYRLYLVETNDSLYGICEALDAKTDLQNQRPEEARVVSTYKVFNNQLEQISSNSNQYELFVGEAVDTDHNVTATSLPPLFFKLDCKIITDKDQGLRPQIIHSSFPDNDGAIGLLQVRKISDSLPNLTQFEHVFLWNRSRRNKKEKEEYPFSFLRKKKRTKEEKEVTQIVPTLSYKERTQEFHSTVEIDSSTISIELYDNGLVDNDTVSLYLNDAIVLEKKRVSGKAIHLDLTLDASKENKLTLFAHNLGDIAPNTAYMIVKNGTKEYKLFLSASLEKNVVILFKLKQ